MRNKHEALHRETRRVFGWIVWEEHSEQWLDHVKLSEYAVDFPLSDDAAVLGYCFLTAEKVHRHW